MSRAQPEGPIEVAFWQWHDANPHVYERLETLTRRLVDRGHRRIGIKMLFEVMRWQEAMRTTGDADGFKLNNNYHALYARLLMDRHPDWEGVFQLRRLHLPKGGHVAPPRVEA